MLAYQSNLTVSQIGRWFVNSRQKLFQIVKQQKLRRLENNGVIPPNDFEESIGEAVYASMSEISPYFDQEIKSNPEVQPDLRFSMDFTQMQEMPVAIPTKEYDCLQIKEPEADMRFQFDPAWDGLPEPYKAKTQFQNEHQSYPGSQNFSWGQTPFYNPSQTQNPPQKLNQEPLGLEQQLYNANSGSPNPYSLEHMNQIQNQMGLNNPPEYFNTPNQPIPEG